MSHKALDIVEKNDAKSFNLLLYSYKLTVKYRQIQI